jgi:peptidoglycan/LPS O-acetylase OafA/YrhL
LAGAALQKAIATMGLPVTKNVLVQPDSSSEVSKIMSESTAVNSGTVYNSLPGHIPALDGLRGVAILLVMLYHFTETYIRSFSGILYRCCDVGWCGVDLFFVLSGFLITGILFDAKSGSHYFRKFYMRRLLRIFPLYYGFLFVLFVLVPLEHRFQPLIQHHMTQQVWLWSYLTNFAYCLSPHLLITKFHLAHFWSLAVEEQFYLIWPAVIFLLQPKTAIRVSAICIGAALLFRLFLITDHVNPVAIFNLTPCRMDSLAAGALCALLVRLNPSTIKLLRVARLITVFSGVGLICILSWPGGSDADNPMMQSIGYSLLACFFAGMLLLSLNPSQDNVLSWLLSCPILVLFGFYSYAIYVFHYPLVHLFNKWFSVNLLSRDLHSRLLGLEVHVLCSVLVSLFIAILSWNLYERHFLKLKKHFVLSARNTVSNPGRPQIKADRALSLGLRQVIRDFDLWFKHRPFLKKSGLMSV